MGLIIDQEQFEEADYVRFERRLQESLVALKQLLQRPGFGEGPATLGAELELTIIDSSGRALPLNRTLLAQMLACYLREAKSGRPVTEWSEEP